MKPATSAFILGLCISLSVPGSVSAASTTKGREVYDFNCTMCHGERGEGSLPGTPDFSRNEGLFSTDLSLLDRIKKGKATCPSYEGILDEREIRDVIAYLRSMN